MSKIPQLFEKLSPRFFNPYELDKYGEIRTMEVVIPPAGNAPFPEDIDLSRYAIIGIELDPTKAYASDFGLNSSLMPSGNIHHDFKADGIPYVTFQNKQRIIIDRYSCANFAAPVVLTIPSRTASFWNCYPFQFEPTKSYLWFDRLNYTVTAGNVVEFKLNVIPLELLPCEFQNGLH